ncbi:hypothetical protein V8F06_014250 [Rhypophila decipiens]
MSTNQVWEDNGSKQLDNRGIMKLIMEEFDLFQVKHKRKVLKGLKIIYCTPRSFEPRQVEDAIPQTPKDNASSTAVATTHRRIMHFGIWGRARSTGKVQELGGKKWLYAHAYYTEDEFWAQYDRKSPNSNISVMDPNPANTLPSPSPSIKDFRKSCTVPSSPEVSELAGLVTAYKLSPKKGLQTSCSAAVMNPTSGAAQGSRHFTANRKDPLDLDADARTGNPPSLNQFEGRRHYRVRT